MDYLLCFPGKNGRARARCLESLSEALTTFAKLSFVSAQKQETVHSLVTCRHLLAFRGLHSHLRWWSSAPSCAKAREYIPLIERESKFLNEKWSLESTECDNHDCEEYSAYFYKSKNSVQSLCKEGSIQPPYVWCLPLTKKIKSQPRLSHSWRNQ